MKSALHDHDGKLSFTRVFPAFVVGSTFLVWLLYVLGPLFSFLPDIEWTTVEGYFEWVERAIFPSVLPLAIVKTGDAIVRVKSMLDKRHTGG
jgi:hypothetical protein